MGVWGRKAPMQACTRGQGGCMQSTLAAVLLLSHEVMLLCQARLATPPVPAATTATTAEELAQQCHPPLQPHSLATPCSTAAEAAAALPEDRLAGLTVPPEPVLMALATTVALAPYLVTAREAAWAKATLQGGVGVCMCQRQG